MRTLIRNAAAIFSPSHPHATDIRIHAGKIVELGHDLQPDPTHSETLIDASGCVIYPGLVNTHHHLAQSVLKGIPAGLNLGLGDWLAEVPYRFWPHFTPELMYDAALLGLYELVRSGATACADHHYLYHASSTPELEDALWQAARDIGIRFVLCRGHASTRGSHRGMQRIKHAPETLDQAIARMEATASRYHQAAPDALHKLVVAPTSLVHSVTPDSLRTLAAFARSHQLGLHSHLLEVDFDEEQAQRVYNKSAIQLAADNDWLGPDVWFAHLVKASPEAIALLAETGTGIAHCPTSNCRLGSGIAPVVTMAHQGMPISIGVDGSASSESASLLQELNLTWLLHRAVHGPAATTAEQVLDWGSRAGAQQLGFAETGSVQPGFAADLVAFDIRDLRYAGCHSTLWAPLLCGEPATVKYAIVQGRLIIADGHIPGIDLHALQTRVSHGIQQLIDRVQQD